MDFKKEYYNEKKKYIELRNYISSQFGQINTNMVGGNVAPTDLKQVEVIFFNRKDLSNPKIKTLLDVDVKERTQILDYANTPKTPGKMDYPRDAARIGDSLISLTEIHSSLAGKGYCARLSDQTNPGEAGATVSLITGAHNYGKPTSLPPSQQLVKSASAPNVMLSGLPQNVQNAVNNCINSFQTLDVATQQKCLMILKKLNIAKTGGSEGFFDNLNNLVGGDLFGDLLGGNLFDGFFGGDNAVSNVKVDSFMIGNKKVLLDLVKQVNKAFGKQLNSVMVVQRIPEMADGTQACILSLYRTDGSDELSY